VAGPVEEKHAAFQEAYRQLMNRLTAFLNLPFDDLSLSDLKIRLAEIGQMEGATEMTVTGRAA
jgi:arsenate reductase